MGYEKEHEQSDLGTKTCIVEATDLNGSVVGREAFATQGEADAYAAKMKAEGHKVEQSSLAPRA